MHGRQRLLPHTKSAEFDPIGQAVLDTIFTMGVGGLIDGGVEAATAAGEEATVPVLESVAKESGIQGAATRAGRRGLRRYRRSEDDDRVDLGTAARRFPDLLNDEYLLEVKNVARLGLSGRVGNQLIDFAAYAAQERLEMQIIVGTATVIDPELAEFAATAGIHIVKVL